MKIIWVGRHLRFSISIVALLLAIGVAASQPPNLSAGDDVLAGLDPFQGLDAFVDLNQVPIPPDFFGNGSLPPTSIVDLIGQPIDPALFGVTDTMIQRLDSTDFSSSTVSTIDIQLVALSLVSINPVDISFSGGPDQLYDVALGVSPLSPSSGVMDMFRLNDDGGFFGGDLAVFPVLTFTRQSDGAVRVYDYAVEGRPPIDTGFSANWSYLCSGALQIPGGTSNFCPGGENQDPFAIVDPSSTLDIFVQRTTGSTTPPEPGDADGDGDVDTDDLDLVVACFGQLVADNPNCEVADVFPPPDGDGVINILDISFVGSKLGS